MLPLFEFYNCSITPNSRDQSRFLASDVLYLPSGRMALYYALQLLGVNSLSQVLVPAYHCGSMVEPIIYLGATPRFFHINKYLEVISSELEQHLSPETKAMLLPHFFGFPQDLEPIREFCTKHNIALIEDCAHAFFQQSHPLGLGSVGDFSITSTVKFFPGVEGGILACNNPSFDLAQIKRAAPSLVNQIKSLLHTLETSASYGRLSVLGKLLNIRTHNADDPSKPQKSTNEKPQTRTLNRESMQWFIPEQIGQDASWGTRFIAIYSNLQHIIDKRRDNYCYYLAKLKDTPNIRPLHPELPDQVIPYIFPLILEQPEIHFPILKQAGVPIWRWEELVVSNCPISTDYRLCLIQLPCHQSLNIQELDWIIDTLISTVTQP